MDGLSSKEQLSELISDLEKRIDDLQHRLPAHSVKPSMIEELEDLEERLEEARRAMRQA